MINSLRNRLIIVLCAMVTVVSVIQGVSTFKLSRDGTSALLDLRLEQVAGRVRGVYVDAIPSIPLRGSQPSRDVVITVWKQGLDAPYRSTDPALKFPRDAPKGFISTEVSGEQWRIYTLREASLVIQVAQRSRVRHELAEESALNTLWPIVTLVPLVCLAVIFVVTRSFIQLNRLGAEVRAIDTGNLQPLPSDGVPVEVLPFIESINRMIGRLAHSLEAERKFISDAAHELRTPLTALQLQANNLQFDMAPGHQERFRELRQGIARSSNLITQLLRLARADASLDENALTRVDISEAIVAAVAEILPIAAAHNIDIGAKEMANAYVCAVEPDVGVALRNLVGNAIRYTPDGGKIDLSMSVRDSFVNVDVIDTGPGIAEDLLPRVFDRFFRANLDIEGSGLGLSIVAAIAHKYGGATMLRNRSDGQTGIIASISFPQAKESAQASVI